MHVWRGLTGVPVHAVDRVLNVVTELCSRDARDVPQHAAAEVDRHQLLAEAIAEDASSPCPSRSLREPIVVHSKFSTEAPKDIAMEIHQKRGSHDRSSEGGPTPSAVLEHKWIREYYYYYYY